MRAWAPLLGIALALVPSVAGAQSGLSGRARYLTGYTHQRPPILGSSHDVWTGVVPELSYLYADDPRALLRVTYAFTAAVHTRDAPEIANRLTLASSYELSNRTTLLVSLDENQTSLSNYLITRPALESSVVVLPTTNVRLLSSTGSETLTWEATPSVRLSEAFEGTYVKSLDPEMDIDNLYGNLVLSGERTWKVDGLGLDLVSGYARLRTPPMPQQRIATFSAAPRWRHDLTPELSTSLSAGASVVLSPDPSSRTVVLPYMRASLLHTLESTSAELSYAGGTLPSGLTGQMLRSHLVTLRASMALSEREQIFLGGSVGYLHGSILDLRPGAVSTADFDAGLADLTFSWQATDWLQLFVRGVFNAQDSIALDEPEIREAAILGLQLSTQRPDGVIVPLRMPQRVDSGDAARR